MLAEGSAPTNYDYILVSQFNSMEELEIYQKHPAHVAFGQIRWGAAGTGRPGLHDYVL